MLCVCIVATGLVYVGGGLPPIIVVATKATEKGATLIGGIRVEAELVTAAGRLGWFVDLLVV